MSSSLIRTVIFDLDGTLVDTEPAAAHAVQQWFVERGHRVSDEDARFVTGRKWEVAFEHLFSRYPVAVPRAEAEKQMIQLYHDRLESELVVVPGSAEAVRSLSEQFQLSLVSGSSRMEIQWALDRLGVRHCFQFILGAEDYAESKPAPDGYLKAISMHKTRPRETLIFEDSTAGIASAIAAGAWVVGLTCTNHFDQNISQAHFQVADLTSVTPAWVRGLRFTERA